MLTPPTVAVIGGGQLARMMQESAIALGINLRALVEAEDGSTGLVTVDKAVGAPKDLDAVRALIDGADVLTFEHEHIPAQTMEEAARVVSVQPPAAALLYAQDKLQMRVRLSEMGIPCPAWARVDNAAELERFGAVIGWPRKVVFGLSDLLIWDGVTSSTGSDNPFEIDDLLAATGFELEIAQTIPSSLTHSVAFLTLRKGIEAAGEPPVIIQGHSADWAAGLWDRVRRRLSYGLTIDDIDDAGRPTRFTLYTADSTCIVELNAASAWRIIHAELHGMGAPMMEALPFEPSLDRPLGRSRISRDVMSITQRAMRTVLREELATELFTAPGILLSGVDSDLIDDLRSWDWKLGTIKTISSGEEPEGPKVTVLPQQSSQPFTEQMRALATELSGVSSLPVSSLGVIQDNPSSAEALYAAKEELVIKAKNAQRVFDAALNRVYAHAVMMRDGIDEMTPELRSLATRWGDPAHPSIVSQSDAIVKQISALPWLAESPVVLEELGYSGSQIARLMSDKRRAEASGLLERLSAADADAADAPATTEEK